MPRIVDRYFYGERQDFKEWFVWYAINYHFNEEFTFRGNNQRRCQFLARKLQALVRGVARRRLRHLPFNGNNYFAIFIQLIVTYGDPEERSIQIEELDDD